MVNEKRYKEELINAVIYFEFIGPKKKKKKR